jgi:hypothetical protein
MLDTLLLALAASPAPLGSPAPAAPLATLQEESLEEQLERRREDLGRNPKPVARLELARWCLDHRLLVEALKQCDAIFEEHPGHKWTSRFLQRARAEGQIAIQLPYQRGADGEAGWRANYRYAAGLPAAARELALIELATAELDAADELEAQRMEASDLDRQRIVAAELLTSTSPRERRAGCDHLRLTLGGHGLKSLLLMSVRDPQEDVRIAAARALGASEDPSVLGPLVDALHSDNAGLAERAAVALGYTGLNQAVPAMAHTLLSAAPATSAGTASPNGYVFFGRQQAYVQDFDVEVATFTAIGDPVINVLTEGSVLEARVNGVTTTRVSFRKVLARSIERLTGDELGSSKNSWEKWWNQSEWRHGSTPTSG